MDELTAEERDFLDSLDPEERDALIEEITGERPKKKAKKEKKENKKQKKGKKKSKKGKTKSEKRERSGDVTQTVDVNVDGGGGGDQDQGEPNFLGAFGGAGPTQIDTSVAEPSFAAPFVPVLQEGIQSLAPRGDSFGAQLGQAFSYALASAIPSVFYARDSTKSSAVAEKLQQQEQQLEKAKQSGQTLQKQEEQVRKAKQIQQKSLKPYSAVDVVRMQNSGQKRKRPTSNIVSSKTKTPTSIPDLEPLDGSATPRTFTQRLDAERQTASKTVVRPSPGGFEKVNLLTDDVLAKFDAMKAKRRISPQKTFTPLTEKWNQNIAEYDELSKFIVSNEPITPAVKARIKELYDLDASALRRSVQKSITTPLSSMNKTYNPFTSSTAKKSGRKFQTPVRKAMSKLTFTSPILPSTPPLPASAVPKSYTARDIQQKQAVEEELARKGRINEAELIRRSRINMSATKKIPLLRGDTLVVQGTRTPIVKKFVRGAQNFFGGRIYKTRGNVAAGKASPLRFK